jgi:hypothetical protein
MKRLFDSDPINKTRQIFHYNESDDSMVIETQADVTACVELTRAEYAATDERAPWKKEMTHFGRVPLDKVDELMQAGIWQDDKALLRWLQNPDHRDFKVRPGKAI